MNYSIKNKFIISNIEKLCKLSMKLVALLIISLLSGFFNVLASSNVDKTRLHNYLETSRFIEVDWVGVVIGVVPFVGVLLAVGFYTLLERKILAIIIIRKGPSKVSYIGILQPFRDAGKLLCKEFIMPTRANIGPFILAPALMLTVRLLG